ncbi:hypothetical protein HDU76_012094 [Blyttiomyces sp. JEL0837]|nr:hypothetical protein HDU76_012094 [Blyttiomyces sp. JEL0837]
MSDGVKDLMRTNQISPFFYDIEDGLFKLSPAKAKFGKVLVNTNGKWSEKKKGRKVEKKKDCHGGDEARKEGDLYKSSLPSGVGISKLSNIRKGSDSFVTPIKTNAPVGGGGGLGSPISPLSPGSPIKTTRLPMVHPLLQTNEPRGLLGGSTVPVPVPTNTSPGGRGKNGDREGEDEEDSDESDGGDDNDDGDDDDDDDDGDTDDNVDEDNNDIDLFGNDGGKKKAKKGGNEKARVRRVRDGEELEELVQMLVPKYRKVDGHEKSAKDHLVRLVGFLKAREEAVVVDESGENGSRRECGIGGCLVDDKLEGGESRGVGLSSAEGLRAAVEALCDVAILRGSVDDASTSTAVAASSTMMDVDVPLTSSLQLYSLGLDNLVKFGGIGLRLFWYAPGGPWLWVLRHDHENVNGDAMVVDSSASSRGGWTNAGVATFPERMPSTSQRAVKIIATLRAALIGKLSPKKVTNASAGSGSGSNTKLTKDGFGRGSVVQKGTAQADNIDAKVTHPSPSLNEIAEGVSGSSSASTVSPDLKPSSVGFGFGFRGPVKSATEAICEHATRPAFGFGHKKTLDVVGAVGGNERDNVPVTPALVERQGVAAAAATLIVGDGGGVFEDNLGFGKKRARDDREFY